MGKRKKAEVVVDEYFIEQAKDIADNYYKYKSQLSEMRYQLENYSGISDDDFIELKSLSGVSYGDKVQTNNVTDSVGKLVLNYNQDLDKMNAIIYKSLFDEYKALHNKIAVFDIGLKLLVGRPSCVARQFFIEKKAWDSIVDENGHKLHYEQIRRARNEAIKNIALFLEKDADRRLMELLS